VSLAHPVAFEVRRHDCAHGRRRRWMSVLPLLTLATTLTITSARSSRCYAAEGFRAVHQRPCRRWQFAMRSGSPPA
jgi:hypothetical protein